MKPVAHIRGHDQCANGPWSIAFVIDANVAIASSSQPRPHAQREQRVTAQAPAAVGVRAADKDIEVRRVGILRYREVEAQAPISRPIILRRPIARTSKVAGRPDEK